MPEHGDEIDILLRNADYAMYSAKENRRGYAIYDPSRADDIATARMSLDGVLNEDIRQNDLYLVYQPVIDLQHRQGQLHRNAGTLATAGRQDSHAWSPLSALPSRAG